jgi:hypothetical protein
MRIHRENGVLKMLVDLGTDPNGEPYDLDLRNSGSGWCGTFYLVIQLAVSDILQDGPWPQAEVTLLDGTVLAGKLDEWTSADTFTITEVDSLPRIVEVDDVARFRA